MIQKSKLLAAALGAAVVATSAFAFDAKAPAQPMPHLIASSVVKPVDLPANFTGATLKVEFSLDQAGQPQDIKVLATHDLRVKKQVADAFRQWRFETVAGNTSAGAKRYVLPIELRPEV